MYGKPSRRLISSIFEKGSAQEPFLRLIIAPKSISSCPECAGQTNKWIERKTNTHEPVAHTGTNRETDTSLLMAERETQSSEGEKADTDKLRGSLILIFSIG